MARSATDPKRSFTRVRSNPLAGTQCGGRSRSAVRSEAMTDALATSVSGTTKEDRGLEVEPTPSLSSRQPKRHSPNGKSQATLSGSDRDIPYPVSRIPAVNVAQVPQRSPLRYPGGKTWLVPHIRAWLAETRPKVLIEPFAGGGIVTLTAVMEHLAERAILVELDRDVAAFWKAALLHGQALSLVSPNSRPRGSGFATWNAVPPTM